MSESKKKLGLFFEEKTIGTFTLARSVSSGMTIISMNFNIDVDKKDQYTPYKVTIDIRQPFYVKMAEKNGVPISIQSIFDYYNYKDYVEQKNAIQKNSKDVLRKFNILIYGIVDKTVFKPKKGKMMINTPGFSPVFALFFDESEKLSLINRSGSFYSEIVDEINKKVKNYKKTYHDATVQDLTIKYDDKNKMFDISGKIHDNYQKPYLFVFSTEKGMSLKGKRSCIDFINHSIRVDKGEMKDVIGYFNFFKVLNNEPKFFIFTINGIIASTWYYENNKKPMRELPAEKVNYEVFDVVYSVKKPDICGKEISYYLTDYSIDEKGQITIEKNEKIIQRYIADRYEKANIFLKSIGKDIYLGVRNELFSERAKIVIQAELASFDVDLLWLTKDQNDRRARLQFFKNKPDEYIADYVYEIEFTTKDAERYYALVYPWINKEKKVKLMSARLEPLKSRIDIPERYRVKYILEPTIIIKKEEEKKKAEPTTKEEWREFAKEQEKEK